MIISIALKTSSLNEHEKREAKIDQELAGVDMYKNSQDNNLVVRGSLFFSSKKRIWKSTVRFLFPVVLL